MRIVLAVVVLTCSIALADNPFGKPSKPKPSEATTSGPVAAEIAWLNANTWRTNAVTRTPMPGSFSAEGFQDEIFGKVKVMPWTALKTITPTNKGRVVLQFDESVSLGQDVHIGGKDKQSAEEIAARLLKVVGAAGNKQVVSESDPVDDDPTRRKRK